MNTEATDELSLNSKRNKTKHRPVVVYNDMNNIPTITLDGNKTPDSKGNRTISNEFDYYNKSRNEDAITCKRDCSKYASTSENNTSHEFSNMKFENQMKGRATYLHKSNDNMHFDMNKALPTDKEVDSQGLRENFGVYFDKAAGPLEEIARANPSLIPLLKLVRKGYEDVCQQIIIEDRKRLFQGSNPHKLRQELAILQRENSNLRQEKENLERANSCNYNLYKKTREENSELQKAYEEAQDKINYFNKHEKTRMKKLENENKDLKVKLEHMLKKDYDILQKLDLDEYNLTSDDLRSDNNKKW